MHSAALLDNLDNLGDVADVTDRDALIAAALMAEDLQLQRALDWPHPVVPGHDLPASLLGLEPPF
jgi:hypothetical protein